ncbi:Uncharacterized protein TPAR_07821 [Tolypocladium paradoxum]|uniref:Uncharacterized protein n=1 Tax=Tolypocladium paradoxum TaxID=94208 RepID=A0A2S4KP48_9HYPO|nr:Uncharacterized protein TPAR_07821 [Tolypocladium paradoxum]
MAIRSALSMGGDGGQDGSGPAAPYRPQPSSPTLTNPDMILPDYDDAESLDGRSQSPLLMWNSNTQNANADFHSFPPNTFNSAPLGPMTPIIYGNGTMLSDIGEVTEVESTVGSLPRHTSPHLSGTGGDGTPLRSSPTMGKKVLKKRTTQNGTRERRLSIESTSTINELERAAPFGDFDDSVSVDDSNFQGDDEESMAESYLEDTSVVKPGNSAKPSGQGLSEDRFSTNSISKRAEQILANAKRRLTTMEGNLNRARTLSYSSVSDGSTPSPVARPATAMRDNTPPMSSTHARNVSETGLQGGSRPTAHLQRSASALGAAGGYRQPLPQSRSADALGSRYSHSANKTSHHPLDMTLAPLSEDGDDTDVTDNSKREGSQSNILASPTFGTYSDAGLTRSASVAQVRDLQDQMQGLKGKISSLKEQARADSMKRRSLQSLRTPSPFTHARWDQAFVEPPAVSTPEIASPRLASPSPWNGTVPGFETSGHVDVAEAETQVLAEEDARSVASGYHEAQETQDEDPKVEVVEESGADHDGLDGSYRDEEDDIRTEDGDADGDGEDDASIADNRSEGGDSLYHDTYQHPVSHEDREDAFDYEHFFLHSAMGTISRQGMGRGDSSDSEDSDESVETTRGPILSRVRRPSLDTFTTVDSFATATEGRASRHSVTRGGRTEDGFVTPSQGYDEAASAKRSTFGGESGSSSGGSGGSGGSGSSSDERDGFQESRPRQNSVLHRPISTSATSTLHRPSVSSFESTGTNRSFPLVNRVRLSGGILTPGGSPEHDLKQVSESLMNETASICDKESINGGSRSPAIQTLSREDQMMVERVVACLGRCVLGLTEASRTNPGSQNEFRRRIDAARKVLEGGE